MQTWPTNAPHRSDVTRDLESSEHQVDPLQDASQDPRAVFRLTNRDLMDPRDPEVFVTDLPHFTMAGLDLPVALHSGTVLHHLGAPRMSPDRLATLNLECVEEEVETFGAVDPANGVGLEDPLVGVVPLEEEDLETEVYKSPHHLTQIIQVVSIGLFWLCFMPFPYSGVYYV